MPAHRDLLWAGWSEDDAMELAHAHAGKYGAFILNHLEHQLLFGKCPVLVSQKLIIGLSRFAKQSAQRPNTCFGHGLFHFLDCLAPDFF